MCDQSTDTFVRLDIWVTLTLAVAVAGAARAAGVRALTAATHVD